MFWKADDGQTYVKLLKGRSEINRLLNVSWASGGKRLQFTSIIEILQRIRNEKMIKMIDALKQQKDKIYLDIDGPSPGKSAASSKAGNPRRRTKPLCDNETWKSLPEIINIDAPEFDDIASISMKLLSSLMFRFLRSDALYVSSSSSWKACSTASSELH